MQILYIVLFLLALGVYFLPCVVAASRDCKASVGIGIVNLFLGWTFVGWGVALAWAACGETDIDDPLPAEPIH